MNGEFTFSDHQAFREVLHKMEGGDVQQVVMDMARVNFIDSAALGMLLLALDIVEKNHKQLVISGVVGQVEKMFALARFNRLFTLN